MEASDRAIRLEVIALGFRGRAAARKTFITPTIARRHLDWCKQYRHWTVEQ